MAFQRPKFGPDLLYSARYLSPALLTDFPGFHLATFRLVMKPPVSKVNCEARALFVATSIICACLLDLIGMHDSVFAV